MQIAGFFVFAFARLYVMHVSRFGIFCVVLRLFVSKNQSGWPIVCFLLPRFPITRLAIKIHYRHDEYPALLFRVKNSVWKSTY